MAILLVTEERAGIMSKNKYNQNTKKKRGANHLMAVKTTEEVEYLKRLEEARSAIGSFDSGGTAGKILSELRNRGYGSVSGKGTGNVRRKIRRYTTKK